MRKTIFVIALAFLLPGLLFGQEQKGKITGKVLDAQTGLPLATANIILHNTTIGAISGQDGTFEIMGVPFGEYILQVGYIGYRYEEISVVLTRSEIVRNIELTPVILPGQEVVVTATRAREGETPAAFSTLSRENIENTYHTQDVPVMLSELPSTTFYSEGGSGIGYNYLSIRGFGQRRISVMINGIPQNDPEDHNVYWVDFPDFLGNVEDIQVQRGAGSAFYGPPAIGGSVNIITTRFSPERRVSAYAGSGSYDTRKYSLAVNSGLLKNEYVFFGRVSQIKTDGYRDRAWVDFKSYFLGAARFGKRSTLRLLAYGGPLEDHLAFYGISKEAAKDKKTRRDNPIVRPDELENFNQPHLELFHQYQIKDDLILNNTLFGIRGYGFFDYDGSWAPASYFRLTPEYGFSGKFDPETIFVDDLLIRAYVDNKQIGWLPYLTWHNNKATVVLGSEIRIHRSLHWGRIQEGSKELPAAVSGEYSGHDYIGSRRYYEYKGAKDIISPYVHSRYRFSERITGTFDLQLNHLRYQLYDEKFIGTDFEEVYNFLNPRVGINYSLNRNTSMFFSYSRTSREPRLKNLYDAAEASTPASWGAIVPQFKRNPDGSFNFDEPLVGPESLNDFEVGLGYKTDSFFADINLFYMDFKDEIIKKGQLDRFGQPITGNAERTLHTGVELSGGVTFSSKLTAVANLSFSNNELKKYTVYAGDGTPTSLDGNPIAGFPDLLANARITYQNKGFTVSFAMQHVGQQYTDNFKNDENMVDAYTAANGMIGFDLGNRVGLTGLTIQLHVQNIFDSLYIAHGEGEAFFPAAERQVFVNTKIDF
jgi:iron complex outermembrane receptor protein